MRPRSLICVYWCWTEAVHHDQPIITTKTISFKSFDKVKLWLICIYVWGVEEGGDGISSYDKQTLTHYCSWLNNRSLYSCRFQEIILATSINMFSYKIFCSVTKLAGKYSQMLALVLYTKTEYFHLSLFTAVSPQRVDSKR